MDSIHKELKKKFIGIDAVIDKTIDNIALWYMTPELQFKPLIISLWGITGVGKTDLVRTLVRLLEFTDKFIEIQMDMRLTYSKTIENFLEDSGVDTTEPAILLLDEHIATLDPRTAKKVLELTELIVREEKMTAMMVTHNMEHALRYGNRLLMMHQGKIVVDIDGERKSKLTIDDLIDAFGRAAGEQFKDDTILLRHD